MPRRSKRAFPGSGRRHTSSRDFETSPHVLAPQQKRSRDALAKIVAAADAILCEQGLAGLSMRAVSERVDLNRDTPLSEASSHVHGVFAAGGKVRRLAILPSGAMRS
jgi:hypothetical protein